MKAYRGIILAEDEETHKMVPFFPIVRSSDIYPNNPIDIDTVLVQSSKRWSLDKMDVRVDEAIYRFVPNSLGDPDPSGEIVGSLYDTTIDNHLNYHLYRDGEIWIEGVIRPGRDTHTTTSAVSGYTGVEYKRISFPYVTPLDHGGYYQLQVGHHPIPGFYIKKVSQKAQIKNVLLNPGLHDTKEYPYFLGITLAYNDSIGDLVKSLISEELSCGSISGFTESGWKDYIKSAIPLHISFRGFWK